MQQNPAANHFGAPRLHNGFITAKWSQYADHLAVNWRKITTGECDVSGIKNAPASAPQSAAYLQHKLAYYTDAWDLAEDLARNIIEIVVIDARSPEVYQAGHICGAMSFPHRQMNAESTAHLDCSKVYITDYDGIGCNGSTKAALKLASLGFQVKELIGGLDFWKRDGHPMAWGAAPGEWPNAAPGAHCGC